MTNSQDPIWRYMNLFPFLCQVIKKGFSFSNLPNLEDLTEGRMKDISIFESVVFTGENKSQSEKEREKYLKATHKKMDKYYVSCWTQTEDENFALWKIFTNQVGGVAIKTTIEKFLQSITIPIEIEHKSVRYKPFYSRPFAQKLDSVDDCVFSKYGFYEYEKEYRFAINLKKNSKPTYIYIPVDFSSMIDKLYLSPYMNESNRMLTEETLNTLDIELSNKLQKSKIQL